MNNMEIGHKGAEVSCSYMEKVFYSLFYPQKPTVFPRENGWHPFTNVYEFASEIVVEMELAGVNENDLQISLHDNFLQIKGIRRERINGDKVLYHQLEVEYGAFERIIYLPFEVNSGKIQYNYGDGFLTIRLSKCSKNS